MFVILNRLKKNEEIIRRCYLLALEREPDKNGKEHFLRIAKNLVRPGLIDEKKLLQILENSPEGKKVKLARKLDKKQEYVFKGKYHLKYSIRPNSALDATVVKKSVLNVWLIEALSKISSKSGVYFDVGANAGLLTLPLAKKCVPRGMVHAFEPDKQVLKQLKKNIKLNKFSNIKIHTLAFQDDPKTKTLTFNINRAVQENGMRNDGLSTIITSNNLYTVSSQQVKATTLDIFVKDLKLKRLDFLKVDTEGADFKVIMGSEKTIKKFRPIILYEHSPALGKLINSNYSEKIFNYLDQEGYIQYYLDDSKKIEKPKYVKKITSFRNDGDIFCIPQENLSKFSIKLPELRIK